MGYINVDLNELLNGTDFVPAILDGGINVLQKRVHLEPPQMGMFTDVDVTKFPDGTAWLDFLSTKYAPNRELMDFMAYCYGRWGKDSRSRGLPSDDDIQPLKKGSFGRTWENVKIIQIKRPEHQSLSIVLRIIIDNEDMSNFINQLAKGFVRSAVNQVGRDGGRVISNQVYNGKNYAPIADITNQCAQSTTPGQTYPSDAHSVTMPLSTGKIIFFCIISLICFPIGSIGVLIYGLVKYLDKSEIMAWTESVPQYVQDRRCTTGARYVGSVTVTRKQKRIASKEAEAINKRNGVISMVIALICGLISCIGMILSK